MNNELNVNGFSALSEMEMMNVAGGFTSQQWIVTSCTVAGVIVGGVVGVAIGGPAGAAIGGKWGASVTTLTSTVVSGLFGLGANLTASTLCK